MIAGSADGWRSRSGLAVLLLVGIGGVARISGLDHTGLWLDEILGVGFVGPEHGPGYYFLIRLGHALGGSEVAFRLPFALAGVATIAAIAAAAWRLAGAHAGVIAAALVAFSPILHYYAREARPYAVLVLWSAVAAWALARLASGRRDTATHAVFGGALALLVLTSSNGIFHAMALLVAHPFAAWGAARRDATRHLGVWTLCAVVVGLLFVASYRGMLQGEASGHWLPAWAMVSSLVDALVSAHSEQGTDVARWAAPAAMVLAVVGAVRLSLGGGQALGVGLVFAALVGFFGPVVALESRGHWLNARYVLSAIVPLLLLVATGLSSVAPAHRATAEGASRGMARWSFALACLVAAAIGMAARGPLARSVDGRADWRHVAGVVADRAHTGDLVLATNDWTAICVGYYLKRAGADLRLENLGESVDRAEALLDGADVAWIVSGGHHANDAIRRRFESLPVTWSHPVEAVRIWFHPDRATYVTTRLATDDAARLEAGFWDDRGGRLMLDDTADPWLVDGWHATERDQDGVAFRWVDGTRARILLPPTVPPPTHLAIEIMPFGPLVATQEVSLTFGEQLLGTWPLRPGWQVVDVDLPHQAHPDRPATLVELTLASAATPASVGMGDDVRLLGAAVRSVAATR